MRVNSVQNLSEIAVAAERGGLIEKRKKEKKVHW